MVNKYAEKSDAQKGEGGAGRPATMHIHRAGAGLNFIRAKLSDCSLRSIKAQTSSLVFLLWGIDFNLISIHKQPAAKLTR